MITEAGAKVPAFYLYGFVRKIQSPIRRGGAYDCSAGERSSPPTSPPHRSPRANKRQYNTRNGRTEVLTNDIAQQIDASRPRAEGAVPPKQKVHGRLPPPGSRRVACRCPVNRCPRQSPTRPTDHTRAAAGGIPYDCPPHRLWFNLGTDRPRHARFTRGCRAGVFNSLYRLYPRGQSCPLRWVT